MALIPFFSDVDPQWRCVLVWEGSAIQWEQTPVLEGGGGSPVTGSSKVQFLLSVL